MTTLPPQPQARLAQLQRRTRLWQSLAVLLALALFALLTLGMQYDNGIYLNPRPNQPAANSVRSEAFMLTDHSGRVRAVLRMENNQPILKFYDPDGHVAWSAPPRLQAKPLQ